MPIKSGFWNEAWFYYAIGLGLLFIIGFNIVAETVKQFGVTVGSVAQKMSLILSVSFAIVYYNESINFLKIMGIVMALVAVVLTNIPSKEEGAAITPNTFKKYAYLIALTFITSAMIEIGLQYVEKNVAAQANDPSFIIFLFFTAAVIGSSYAIFQVANGKMKIEKKNIIAGIVLGVPNYFSIYFLMLTLGVWDGSIVFPVTNVGIISVASIAAYFIFNEKLSRLNILGVLAALTAILMIGFA